MNSAEPTPDPTTKECGCLATVWCACRKFREYYDAEQDPPNLDTVSN